MLGLNSIELELITRLRVYCWLIHPKRSLAQTSIHCLNQDLLDLRISMIFFYN